MVPLRLTRNHTNTHSSASRPTASTAMTGRSHASEPTIARMHRLCTSIAFSASTLPAPTTGGHRSRIASPRSRSLARAGASRAIGQVASIASIARSSDSR